MVCTVGGLLVHLLLSLCQFFVCLVEGGGLRLRLLAKGLYRLGGPVGGISDGGVVETKEQLALLHRSTVLYEHFLYAS